MGLCDNGIVVSLPALVVSDAIVLVASVIVVYGVAVYGEEFADGIQ